MIFFPTVSFNNSLLIPVEQIRYLGLHLNKRHIWSPHTRLKRRKTSKYLLDKLTKFLLITKDPLHGSNKACWDLLD